MEVGFFPGTQRLRYPRSPSPAQRGTRLTKSDNGLQGTHARLMLCVNHLIYQLGWFWALGVEDKDTEDDELQVYLK